VAAARAESLSSPAPLRDASDVYWPLAERLALSAAAGGRQPPSPLCTGMNPPHVSPTERRPPPCRSSKKASWIAAPSRSSRSGRSRRPPWVSRSSQARRITSAHPGHDDPLMRRRIRMPSRPSPTTIEAAIAGLANRPAGF
jgi:hypothetical protein